VASEWPWFESAAPDELRLTDNLGSLENTTKLANNFMDSVGDVMQEAVQETHSLARRSRTSLMARNLATPVDRVLALSPLPCFAPANKRLGEGFGCCNMPLHCGVGAGDPGSLRAAELVAAL
jgi:hypothetical protein